MDNSSCEGCKFRTTLVHRRMVDSGRGEEKLVEHEYSEHQCRRYPMVLSLENNIYQKGGLWASWSFPPATHRCGEYEDYSND